MRVVLDTNVLLSAVLGRALAPILEAWIAGRFVLIISNAIIREYVDVLSRPKFGLPPSVTDAIVSYLLHRAEFVTPAASAGVIACDHTYALHTPKVPLSRLARRTIIYATTCGMP